MESPGCMWGCLLAVPEVVLGELGLVPAGEALAAPGGPYCPLLVQRPAFGFLYKMQLMR